MLDDYLNNPCKVHSIPLWKVGKTSVPSFMRIVHELDFELSMLDEYEDEPYFRLRHNLVELAIPELPAGFHFCTASIEEFANHINRCYPKPCVTVDELRCYQDHPVYAPDLSLAVRDDCTGRIVASGIGELDREIGEGILEWIQVSEEHRGMGLGSCVVLELLHRMKGMAEFVTVSGQCKNPWNPESLYRKCGFTGSDIWHILRKR